MDNTAQHTSQAAIHFDSTGFRHIHAIRRSLTKLTSFCKLILPALGIALMIFVGLQFIRPKLSDPPVTAEIVAPPEVKAIFKHSCYSCHSNETKLPWFDQMVPAYWIVSSDVQRARAHLNFSEIAALPEEQQRLALFDAFNQIRLGAMPLPSYRMVHPNSTVTPEQLDTLRKYLTTLSEDPQIATSSQVAAAEREYLRWVDGSGAIHTVQSTLEGVPFHPEYKTWKQIGSTERVENHTIRVVLGNDLAVKAIADNHINPWPDGAMIGKVTWHEKRDPSRMIGPGQFVQVELMIRDSKKYQTTAGWGWGRWIGTDLKPDGHTADFASTHCVDCHHAVRRNDYVFTMPINAQQGGAK